MWPHVLKEGTRLGLIGESHMFLVLHHRALRCGGNAGGLNVTELLSHLPHSQPGSMAAWINN